MKKKYIKPAIGRNCMAASELLTASVGHVDGAEAAAGTSGDPVNLSRQGSFWDDSE